MIVPVIIRRGCSICLVDWEMAGVSGMILRWERFLQTSPESVWTMYDLGAFIEVARPCTGWGPDVIHTSDSSGMGGKLWTLCLRS